MPRRAYLERWHASRDDHLNQEDRKDGLTPVTVRKQESAIITEAPHKQKSGPGGLQVNSTKHLEKR